jgi:hypothetical protein
VRAGCQDKAFHSHQGGREQKFSPTGLDVKGIRHQRQCLHVKATSSKTGAEIADKIHIEHFMTLGLKLLRRPLQQRNAATNVVLKEKPPASHPGCDCMERFQGVSCGEVAQLRDVLL